MLEFRGYSLLTMSPGTKIFLALAVIWTLIWKGIALWKAGQNGQLPWFVVLLLVNTLGILEIIYIVWFAKKAPGKINL